MTRTLVLAVLALVASCSMARSRQNVEFERLHFQMPGDWQHKDQVFKGVATTIWTPEENADDRESITVIRSELAPALAHASEDQLATLVEHAQRYAGARVTPAMRLETANGWSGARVEVDYIPPGLHERYHRVHVVLLAGTSVVHVLYTARHPDPQLTALNTVLGTIRRSSQSWRGQATSGPTTLPIQSAATLGHALSLGRWSSNAIVFPVHFASNLMLLLRRRSLVTIVHPRQPPMFSVLTRRVKWKEQSF